ncbi:MAG: YdeI/OmpD-associated family protein, partial [Oscillospiraceae bacterium]|nr:YdeI/OmpD-associated family protein [Oscillospiraceae bacterium]
LANGERASHCWINISTKPSGGAVFYLDAVEEALCFGWIDSTKKQGLQRFSPRTKHSNWTELNKERVRRLERLGLMTDRGRACLPDMGFAIHPEVLAALKADEAVHANFLALPPLYQRVRIDNIQTCLRRNQQELFESRLQRFIESTRRGEMYGAWHDGGRLLEGVAHD